MGQYDNKGFIIALESIERFVFGSNLAGHHADGAAFQAKEQFRAVEGIGEGLTGNCYAFPTLHANFTKLSSNELYSAKEAFYRCANAHPELTFILTKVGCGIAGFAEQEMVELFRNAPANVIKPRGWGN